MQRGMGTLLCGALMGVGLQQLVSIGISARLHLGYYMACVATLPELAGGEIRAVVLQTGVCALAGAGTALALRLARQRQWRTLRRLAAAASALLIGLTPAAALLLCASYGL